MGSLLFLAIITRLISASLAYGNIPIKFKGNTLCIQEYEQLDLCTNKWCLEDANRILLEMSYNNSVDPCDNFDEFVCGTFNKERAYNERYNTVGFKTFYKKLIDEKRDRMLRAPITDGDLKVVKVTKNFYQKCVNSSKSIFFLKMDMNNFLNLFKHTLRSTARRKSWSFSLHSENFQIKN